MRNDIFQLYFFVRILILRELNFIHKVSCMRDTERCWQILARYNCEEWILCLLRNHKININEFYSTVYCSPGFLKCLDTFPTYFSHVVKISIVKIIKII